jgi:hypothetical protein
VGALTLPRVEAQHLEAALRRVKARTATEIGAPQVRAVGRASLRLATAQVMVLLLPSCCRFCCVCHAASRASVLLPRALLVSFMHCRRWRRSLLLLRRLLPLLLRLRLLKPTAAAAAAASRVFVGVLRCRM